jgi:hypothetical protein
MTSTYKILAGKPEGKRPIGSLGVVARIILERILGKQGGELRGLDSQGSEKGPLAVSSEQGNEPSVS